MQVRRDGAYRENEMLGKQERIVSACLSKIVHNTAAGSSEVSVTVGQSSYCNYRWSASTDGSSKERRAPGSSDGGHDMVS